MLYIVIELSLVVGLILGGYIEVAYWLIGFLIACRLIISIMAMAGKVPVENYEVVSVLSARTMVIIMGQIAVMHTFMPDISQWVYFGYPASMAFMSIVLTTVCIIANRKKGAKDEK